MTLPAAAPEVLRFPADPVPVSLEIHTSNERDFVLARWRELEERFPDRGLMCSSDWTEIWLRTYGDTVPHRFVLAWNGTADRICGICLLTEGVSQSDGPVPLRTLHVGTAGEPERDSVCVEYNRLLVDPNCERAFKQRLVEYLNAQSGIDQWNLDGFDESDITDFQAEPSELNVRTETAHWCDLAQLRDEGKDILSGLRSDTRRRVRRSLESYEGLRVEWADTLVHARDIFDELVRLHQSRWTSLGKSGSYASPLFRKFHGDLLDLLINDGRMILFRVRSGSATVGCVQLLIDRGRVLLYQCGWVRAYGKHSPGVVVDYLAMCECLERGYDAYDFLAYETQHKRHLSNASHNLIWARKRHPRFKFAVLNRGRQLKQWLRPVKSED